MTKPLAFSVHLLTASGAALALMALVAATQGNWQLMFAWLVLALLVDGIDGPLARKVDIKKNAAHWDGALLDLIIDYLTYVFIPAYALIYTGILPGPWGLVAALLVALTGVFYLADVRMKNEDYTFSGFPAVWNMVVLVLLTLNAGPRRDDGGHRRAGGGAVLPAEVHPSGADAALARDQPADDARLDRLRVLGGLGGLRAAARGPGRPRGQQPVDPRDRRGDAGPPAARRSAAGSLSARSAENVVAAGADVRVAAGADVGQDLPAAGAFGAACARRHDRDAGDVLEPEGVGGRFGLREREVGGDADVGEVGAGKDGARLGVGDVDDGGGLEARADALFAPLDLEGAGDDAADAPDGAPSGRRGRGRASLPASRGSRRGGRSSRRRGSARARPPPW
jgi:phosphatidylglycerophosphate synthase